MTGTDFITSSANITIINPSGTVIVNNQPMTTLSTGKFIYHYQHNLTGNHLGYATIYNGSGIIAIGEQSMQIKIPEIGVSSGGVNMSAIILLVSLLGMAILLLVIATQLTVQDYGILQFLLVGLAIILLIMVPKVALDNKDHCALTPTNLSMSAIGTLDYNYDYVCVERT